MKGDAGKRKKESGKTNTPNKTPKKSPKKQRPLPPSVNVNPPEPFVDLETVTLSKSQETALKAIMNRKPVFFTGAAGTGDDNEIHVLLD